MLQKVVVALSLIAIPFSPGAAVAAGGQKSICVSAAGELLLRKKCKAGESPLSSVLLSQKISESVGGTAVGPTGQSGPKGPTGDAGVQGVKGTLDFSQCRTVSDYATNFANTSNGALDVSLVCNSSTEILFDDEYRANAFVTGVGTIAFLQARSAFQATIGSDTKEYGATLYFNRHSSGGDGSYEVLASGICCPR